MLRESANNVANAYTPIAIPITIMTVWSVRLLAYTRNGIIPGIYGGESGGCDGGNGGNGGCEGKGDGGGDGGGGSDGGEGGEYGGNGDVGGVGGVGGGGEHLFDDTIMFPFVFHPPPGPRNEYIQFPASSGQFLCLSVLKRFALFFSL